MRIPKQFSSCTDGQKERSERNLVITVSHLNGVRAEVLARVFNLTPNQIFVIICKHKKLVSKPRKGSEVRLDDPVQP